MVATISEWDEKHRAVTGRDFAKPASVVRELLPLLPRGTALDLACGTGRHALLLAAHGCSVVAVDWSPVALEILEARAHELHIPCRRVTWRHALQEDGPAGIYTVLEDLEKVRLPADSFTLIVSIQYLQRSLFVSMEEALKPGGILLFETFTKAQLQFLEGPKNPEFLLEPGELRRAFSSLHTLFYRELCALQGAASLLAQKPILSAGRNKKQTEHITS